MNYRHAFHAGNFADLIKHAALILLVQELARSAEPLTVIDTHGGAGAYDLRDEMALRSGEAAAGVGRLMAEPGAPEALSLLKGAVARFSPDGIRRYPGSPVLAAEMLRPGDRLIACELRPDDYESLRRALTGFPNAKAVRGDGYALAMEQARAGRSLTLIDPPFERPDDYDQAAAALNAITRGNSAATVAIWLPLKDLETFDAFLRQLEVSSALILETRLRPLSDPMKMNGCALALANAPPAVEAPLAEANAWIVGALGEKGGEARNWRLRT